MTEGLHRFYGAGDLHFLTFSCYERQPLFDDPVRREIFLQSLERTRRNYRLVVLGYVVMPEHVHLLVSEPQRKTLSIAVQALKIGFVRRLEGIDNRSVAGVPRSRKNSETWGTLVGETRVTAKPFWQARFYDFNVFTEEKRIEKLRYIHRNPVERGLVSSPDLWPWSSFRWYRFGDPDPVRINDTDIMVMTIRKRPA
jgi:Transposase and inactivated derivatives